jgi:hypothetical protein
MHLIPKPIGILPLTGQKRLATFGNGTTVSSARTAVRAYSPDFLNPQAHTLRRVHLPIWVHDQMDLR